MAETQGLPSGSFPSNREAGNEPLQWGVRNAVASLAHLGCYGLCWEGFLEKVMLQQGLEE
ncbi:hypothetical protein D623_10015732 [Myotis brandtii]|uniref:Uncharacterized protein n=1 Tax=Myotis brandtii TaxID=109478 RepID=S7P598_MYOBR|nr:hypothetical protein D623_10015732 [Myotis brandtii]